jgi:hypothetical protein
MNQTIGPLSSDLDARNRAATYQRDAQEETAKAQDAVAQKNASEFERIVWLKHLDHSHELQMRMEDRRAAMELKRLELEQRATPLNGTEALAPSIWNSKLLLAFLATIPVVVPLIYQLCRRREHRRKKLWFRQRPVRFVRRSPLRIHRRRRSRFAHGGRPSSWTWKRW